MSFGNGGDMARSWYESKKLNAALDLIQKVAVVAGIPIGIYTYWATAAHERREAEIATYEKLDDRYWAYQRLCMDHPHLDVSDVVAEDKELAKVLKPRDKLTPEERVRERQILSLFYSMCERAFLMYADKSEAFKKRQWAGWDAWIRRQIGRPSFRDAWAPGGNGYDTSFEAYISGVRAELEAGK